MKPLNEINLELENIIEFIYWYTDTEKFTDVSKFKQEGQDLILEPLPVNPDHFLLHQVSPKFLFVTFWNQKNIFTIIIYNTWAIRKPLDLLFP